MTPELLASTAAIALSLIFSYIPGFKTWYEPKSPDVKRLVMLGLLLLTAAITFGLACADLVTAVTIACTFDGAWGLFQIFITAMIANQAAYLLSPKGSK